jgi:hypothetical protein
MSVKKALAIFALVAIVGFAALVLINTFLPNPYTATVYTWITVDIPTFLSTQMLGATVGIGGALTTIGLAAREVGKIRNTATEKVAVAETEATNAKNMAADTFGEIQTLKDEKAALTQQVLDMQASRTEAEQLVTQQQAEIKALQIALDQANDKLTSVPYREVVVHK